MLLERGTSLVVSHNSPGGRCCCRKYHDSTDKVIKAQEPEGFVQKSQNENKQRWDLNRAITILDPQTTELPHPGGNGNETQVPECPGAQNCQEVRMEPCLVCDAGASP